MKGKIKFQPTTLSFYVLNITLAVAAVFLLPIAFWLSKEFYNALFSGYYAYAPNKEGGLYLRMAFDAFELLAVSIFYLMAAFAVYGLLLRFFRKEEDDQTYLYAINKVQAMLGAVLIVLFFIPFLLPGETSGGFYHLVSAFVIDVYSYPATQAGGEAARAMCVFFIAIILMAWAFTVATLRMDKEKGSISSLSPKLLATEQQNAIFGKIVLGIFVAFTVLPLVFFIFGAQ